MASSTHTKQAHKCSECHMVFGEKRILRKHERRHNGEKPYTCEICSKSFAISGNLTRHRRTHTGEKPYTCDLCPKTFGCSSSRARHQRTHDGNAEKTLVCSLCGMAYTSQDGLARHVRLHTGEKPYSCTDCDRRFYTTTELSLHRKTFHTNSGTIILPKCNVCQRTFSSSGNLRAHKKALHDSDPPAHACAECGRTFKRRGELKAHQLTHSAVKPEQCTFCPKFFKSSQNLSQHTRRKHTGEKLHVCPAANCAATFYTKTEMIGHNSRIHLRKKSESCPHCPKLFVAKFELIVHIRTHTKEQPYACDTCDKKFSTRSGLGRHLRSHLAEKPYSCSKCEKTYKSLGSMQGHMLTAHNPDGADAAKRQCEICRKFVMALDFVRHQKIHTRNNSQRPFKCGICAKSYYAKDNLTKHLVQHGPKNHMCTFCDKTFHVHSSFQTHLRVHLGELPMTSSLRPFECKICDKSYKTKAHLHRHIGVHGPMTHAYPICGREFHERDGISQHPQLDTGDKSISGLRSQLLARQTQRLGDLPATAESFHTEMQPVVRLSRLEHQIQPGHQRLTV